ncbi:histidine phosphatase family protein [Candidatus Woesearchaeota archaeon]|nr:histidine phosphatase family protein [Candidatus Woesearchaeota archaeon]
MELILVRHGETFENITGICQGHLNSQLTPTGIQQAREIALFLKGKKIDYAFSSDLDRAKDTLMEILTFHKNISPILTKDLREQSKGIYEGKSNLKRNEDLDKLNIPYYIFKPEEGESLIEVWERVIPFLEKVMKEYKESCVLIVGHGGPLSCLLTYLHDKPIEFYKNYLPKKNTALSMVQIEGNKKTFHKINCTEHLNLLNSTLN